MKKLVAVLLMFFVANSIWAQDDKNPYANVDANSMREAIGMDAVTTIPMLVLIVFLVIMVFAVSRIPGLKS